MIGPQPNPLIQKFRHLYPLSDEEQAALEGAFARILYCNENEDIVLEGDRPSECNVLREGMTIRYQVMPDGKRQIFSFHIPGDMYDGQYASATRRSAGALMLFTVPSSDPTLPSHWDGNGRTPVI